MQLSIIVIVAFVLISRRPPHLLLVTHPEHARVVGALAPSWGNDRFAAPARPEAFAHVATHHDDGWAELDALPAHSEAEARPAHFLEVDLPLTVEPYRRGVDAIHAHDPYAGALASMHWGGLYSSRWGLQEGPPVGHPAAAAVVEEQQGRWVGALRAAWAGEGPRSRLEADAWHGYEVLQALDLISLALCLVDLSQPTGAGSEPLPVAATLRGIDQPDGARIVPGVPTGASGEHVALTLAVAEPGVVALDPWPFGPETIDLEIAARALEDRAYPDAQASAQAYAQADEQLLRATLVSRPAG
jgi:hypothetical protein